jgi:hypothetical protein
MADPTTPDRPTKLRTITEDLEEFTETVHNAGMFDYFEPKMWFADDHYGRAMVAAWWLVEHPEGFEDPGVEENMKGVLERGGPEFQEEFFFVLPEMKKLVA